MSTLPVLLLVDDDDEIRDQMKWALASEYQMLEASDRIAALAQVRRAMPELVLLDLGLPPDVEGASEGLAILREALLVNPTAKVIVITGNSDRAKAMAAIETGAYDFIEKPVRLDVLKVLLQRANYLSGLERENRALMEQTVQGEAGGGPRACEEQQVVGEDDHRHAGDGGDHPLQVLGATRVARHVVDRVPHH